MITLQADSVTDIVIVDSEGTRYKLENEDRLKHLKKCEELGQTGDMKWFLEQTKVSYNTAKDTILYPFRQELEQFVSYPGENGKNWRFKKSEMKMWLEQNWYRYAK